jgi:hypothetical protein
MVEFSTPDQGKECFNDAAPPHITAGNRDDRRDNHSL